MSAPRRLHSDELSAAEARRIALAAQGFAERRPAGRIDVRHLRRVLDRIAVLQLDSVNVLCRSHYLPLFSRLGSYPRALIDRLAAHHPPGAPPRVPSPERRELFEYWAHEASLVPVRLQPLLRWRMERADREAWDSVRRLGHELPTLVEQVLRLVEHRGPLRPVDTGLPKATRPEEAWARGQGKTALEYLFFQGRVTTACRVNFERVYDLAERVLPASVLAAATPAPEEAQRELVCIAARALGVATEPDLGDYFRLPRAESKQRVAELLESGELLPVSVEGWQAPAYLAPGARSPRRVQARALLSPFDPLVWRRERAERLFSFRYRLEIYTPAHKRVHGYYVLPFLLGEQLLARVDLKADRAGGTLRVLGVHGEQGCEEGRVAPALAAELELMASWLGLERVAVQARGSGAGALAQALARSLGPARTGG